MVTTPSRTEAECLSPALREAVLGGVLVAAEAHVENASLHELLLVNTGLVALANLHGMIALLLLAIRDRAGLATGSNLRRMVEEQLVRGHALPDAGLDRLGAVVRRVCIEISAEAVLAPCAWGHGDPDIQVVGPAHDLQVNSKRKVHVYDVLVQVALGIVDKLALSVVAEMDAVSIVAEGGGKGLQDGLALHRDLSVLHRANHDLVASHEWATHGNLVRCGQAVCEGRCQVTGLDNHLRVLDQVVLTLLVKIGEAVVKSLDMRVSPNEAVPGRRNGRLGLGRRCAHSPRKQEHDDDKDDKHRDAQRAAEHNVGLLRGHVAELARPSTHVLVVRLHGVGAAATDVGHHTRPSRLAGEHSAGPARSAAASAAG